MDALTEQIEQIKVSIRAKFALVICGWCAAVASGLPDRLDVKR